MEKAQKEIETFKRTLGVDLFDTADDNDPLRVYFRQACKEEWVLDRETERQVIQAMITARQEWCHALLSIPSVSTALTSDVQDMVDEASESVRTSGKWHRPDAENVLMKRRSAQKRIEESRAIQTPEASDTVREIVDRDFRLPQWFQRKYRELQSFGARPDVSDADLSQLSTLHEEWLLHRERLVKSCTKLSVFVAKKHWQRGGDIQQFLDLIEEGNIGLMRGIDKFSPSFDNKLSTYAYWWIEQAIRHSRQVTARTVYFPAHIQPVAYKIVKFDQSVFAESGHHPTDQDIMKKLNISLERVQRAKQFLRSEGRLDKQVGQSDNCSLGDLLEDPHAPDPAIEASISDMREAILQFLLTLPTKDRDKMIRYYGLGLVEDPSDDPSAPIRYRLDPETYGMDMTLEELGEELGLTRERVRQVNQRSIELFQETNHPAYELLENHHRNLWSDTHTQPEEEKESYEDLQIDPRLAILPIAQFDFSTLQILAFAREGIFFIGDLVRRIVANTVFWISATKLFKRKCFLALKSIGLENVFSLDAPTEPPPSSAILSPDAKSPTESHPTQATENSEET